ncbi:MAG: hypothetical protein ACR2PZ_17735 [Pseudomonadales bacterium]
MQMRVKKMPFKITVALGFAGWLITSAAYAEFITIYQFSDGFFEVKNPVITGIRDGRVYGVTDAHGGPLELNDGYFWGQHAFALDLDGGRFQSLTLREIAEVSFNQQWNFSGPLTVTSERFYVSASVRADNADGSPVGVHEETILAFDTSTLEYADLFKFSVNASFANPIEVNDRLYGGIFNDEAEQGIWSATASGEDFQLLAPTPTPVTKLVATADGSTLYGAYTPSGTPSIPGAVFAINVDGTGYRELLTIDNAISGLALVGDRLLFPGADGLYSIQTDGSDYHRVSTQPIGIHFSVYDDFIFGALGDQVYRMNIDGSGYTVLQEFENAALNPDLLLIGSTLYGSSRTGNGLTGGEGGGFYYAIIDPLRTLAVAEPISTVGYLAFFIPLLLRVRYPTRIWPR